MYRSGRRHVVLLAMVAALVVGPWAPGLAQAAISPPAGMAGLSGVWPKPVSPMNLLSNPSFEAGVQGWVAWHGEVSHQLSGGRHGSSAARVNYVAPDVLTDHDVYRLGNWPGEVRNPSKCAIYTASVWVKGEGTSVGKPVWLVIREHDGADNQVESAVFEVPLRKNWKQLTVTHTVQTDGIAYLDIYVAQRGAVPGDHFLADDFALYGPCPGSTP